MLVNQMNDKAEKIRESLITLGLAIGFTTIVIILSGAPALETYMHLIKGSLGSKAKFGQVLQAWIPLTLCSCGLLYTFRIGLWNIGVEGQVVMGAIAATAVFRMDMTGGSPVLMMTCAAMASVLCGAVWAFFSGYLKIRSGVNEIFAGLGMNFVAQGLILWLIFGPWKRPGIASMSGTEMLPSEFWLPFSAFFRISPLGLGVAVAAILFTAIFLGYTRAGLRLKAMGCNPYAAHMYRISVPSYMLLAMLLAGGFAGLAGFFQVSGVYHSLIPTISSKYGYLALLVVMVSGFNAWISPVVAFFFACLNVGAIQLPMVMKIDSSLAGVIQGSLVLSTIAVQAWHAWKTNKDKA